VNIKISNPIWGWLFSIIFLGLIVVASLNSIHRDIKYQQDLKAAFTGIVVDQGMDSGGDSAEYCYLVIENGVDQKEKRFCRFEGYSLCKIGDKITKKEGRGNIPLPEGKKSAKDLLEEMEKTIKNPEELKKIQELKKHYTYD